MPIPIKRRMKAGRSRFESNLANIKIRNINEKELVEKLYSLDKGACYTWKGWVDALKNPAMAKEARERIELEVYRLMQKRDRT